MPSFDIVNKTDMQEVDNAVNSVKREIDNRYDFKGSACTIELDGEEIKLIADNDYQLGQMQDMLKVHFTRRKMDSKVLDFNKAENASGNTLRQLINVRQGIDKDTAKNIVKFVKDTKIKVQVSVRGEEVRVDGKKRDDLQSVITELKAKELEIPLQFINFRD
ncbi:MAG: YajQ family cyclic di-GMP-binding protein [Rickettsiales bacterium]|nr:YajQ family cyclic di-GMP-binding protein [Rickettsiales bacterium]